MIDFKNDKTSDLLHKFRWKNPRLRVRRVELNALIRSQYVKFRREPHVCSWMFFDGPTPHVAARRGGAQAGVAQIFLGSRKFRRGEHAHWTRMCSDLAPAPSSRKHG
jgi:hypothetical protein